MRGAPKGSSRLSAFRQVSRQPCPASAAPLKRLQQSSSNRSRAMTAILVIAIFLGVILALNFFEFGRVD
jgi:hypothetical protein